MIELYIDGRLADMQQKAFTYTLQVNDMFQFDTREFSYSESIYLPTTPTNRAIFGFADQIDGESVGAYKKYKVDYYVNGVPIVENGNGFLIGKRGDVYIFSFKDNSRDLYSRLNGLSVNNLPLSELNHTKWDGYIRNQLEGANVIYAVADYGAGYDNSDYNFDYCPASIRMGWILDKIKDLYWKGIKGEFFGSELWQNLYITTTSISQTEIKAEEVYNFEGKTDFVGTGVTWVYPNGKVWERAVRRKSIFKIPKNGRYRISGKVWSSSKGVNQKSSIWVKANGKEYGWWENDPSVEIDFTEGTDIYTEYIREAEGDDNISLKIEYLKGGAGSVDGNVNDFPLLDWFKEIMCLFGLTPIKEKNGEGLTFYTLAERVNEAPVLDWSDKFVQIKEETYHNKGNYAQINRFRYAKYDTQTKEQSRWDYSLQFRDESLADRKYFDSKFYSPKNDISEGWQGLNMIFFEYWVKEEKSGLIDYKPKDGRFHLFEVKRVMQPLGCMVTGPNEPRKSFTYTAPLLANFAPLMWKNLIETYYKDLPRLMEHCYCVTAEFNLSEVDIHNFSFYSRIYVRELGCYFLPNKIVYKAGALAQVEMIRIR